MGTNGLDAGKLWTGPDVQEPFRSTGNGQQLRRILVELDVRIICGRPSLGLYIARVDPASGHLVVAVTNVGDGELV